ncbi:MAG: superoxide dismutase [Phycisphaerae bacterium]|nr:superoxide dismutase [Phycisphaerae bacterium]
MKAINRREMMGSLGTLAAAGGWIGLTQNEAVAGETSTDGPLREYVLPPLPYDYDALEPHIDHQTMQLHHDKHHAAYVKGLNEAIAGLEAVRKSGSPDDLAKVRGLTDSLAFNGSGHLLHTVFWGNMKKGGGGEPKGALARQIERSFGSYSAFRAHFDAAATKVQGSGWGLLAWEPLSARLIVLAAEKHQNLTMFGCVPLLVLDVWEHAYYLKYQSDRTAYVKAFWNIIHWDNVDQRLSGAMKLTL